LANHCRILDYWIANFTPIITMTVRFLRDVECIVLQYWECGDRCCSGYEEDGTDFFKAGDEAEEYYQVSLRDLEEGVDYEYI